LINGASSKRYWVELKNPFVPERRSLAFFFPMMSPLDVFHLLRANPGVTVSVHDRFSDAELWKYLSSLSISILPYRLGTHSGWAEACFVQMREHLTCSGGRGNYRQQRVDVPHLCEEARRIQ
jgi:hypothetical protein